jgi:hypothetical protein
MLLDTEFLLRTSLRCSKLCNKLFQSENCPESLSILCVGTWFLKRKYCKCNLPLHIQTKILATLYPTGIQNVKIVTTDNRDWKVVLFVLFYHNLRYTGGNQNMKMKRLRRLLLLIPDL